MLFNLNPLNPPSLDDEDFEPKEEAMEESRKLILPQGVPGNAGGAVSVLKQAYEVISKYYGERTAERHNIPLMRHIDQGLAILNLYQADDMTAAAFCLHPLVQADSDLPKNQDQLFAFPAECVMLVMEYRNIANQGLRGKKDPAEISIPLPQVKLMLIADKIQNRYSFMKHHATTHPDAEALNLYFKKWLDKLGVTENQYETVVKTFES